MSRSLKVGDRVRVRAENHLHGYQVGDVGTVLKVLKNPTGGDTHFYVVAMDKNHLVGGGMAFSEDEIEPDV
jgi:hypothetical protein